MQREMLGLAASWGCGVCPGGMGSVPGHPSAPCTPQPRLPPPRAGLGVPPCPQPRSCSPACSQGRRRYCKHHKTLLFRLFSFYFSPPSLTVLLLPLSSRPSQMSPLLLLLLSGSRFTLLVKIFFFQRRYLTRSVASLLSKMIFYFFLSCLLWINNPALAFL